MTMPLLFRVKRASWLASVTLSGAGCVSGDASILAEARKGPRVINRYMPWIKERPAGYAATAISIRAAAAVRLGGRDRQAAGRQPPPLGRAAVAAAWVVERRGGLSGGKPEEDPVGPRTQGSSDADSDSRGTRASADDGAEPSRALLRRRQRGTCLLEGPGILRRAFGVCHADSRGAILTLPRSILRNPASGIGPGVTWFRSETRPREPSDAALLLWSLYRYPITGTAGTSSRRLRVIVLWILIAIIPDTLSRDYPWLCETAQSALARTSEAAWAQRESRGRKGIP